MTRARLVIMLAVAVVVAIGGALGAVGSAISQAPVHELGAIDLFALALAAALGDRLELPRQHGRATTMSIAVITCVALLTLDPVQVLAMAAAAWIAQAVRSVRTDRSIRLGSLANLGLTAWTIGGVTALAAARAPGGVAIGESELLLTPVVVVWVLLLFGAPALEALEVAILARGPRRVRYRDLVMGGLQANTVLAATATLGALAYPELKWPTVLLMALPLLAAKLGFDRNAETRTTYDQTLRAMSRLPEQLGAVDPGHGERAGEVAAVAAVDLGFGADVVADIERAAQLHELGRIRTEHGLDLTPEEVAHGGAGIVTEAGALDRVAQLIAAHRGPVPVGDEVAWVGGAIVRLACDLDLRLTSRGERVLQPADQSWIRAQGVQPRIAEAVIRSAQVFYASAAPTP